MARIVPFAFSISKTSTAAASASGLPCGTAIAVPAA
jgi:hypothetical protein